MYTQFFGLSEHPFSISPNPKYLYMSERHGEALAHLSYGLQDGGGFVLLTGEVGTGKTTVSRCLLQQLPAETEIAYILNPSLTERDLLAAICDEFQLSYPAEAGIKLLFDLIRDHVPAPHQVQEILLVPGLSSGDRRASYTGCVESQNPKRLCYLPNRSGVNRWLPH